MKVNIFFELYEDQVDYIFSLGSDKGNMPCKIIDTQDQIEIKNETKPSYHLPQKIKGRKIVL